MIGPELGEVHLARRELQVGRDGLHEPLGQGLFILYERSFNAQGPVEPEDVHPELVAKR